MFKKTTIIKGLIALLVVGGLATFGWAGLKMVEQKKEIKKAQTEKESQKEKVDAGKMLEEIRKDYDRKCALLRETVKEKAKLLREKNAALSEFYQLQLWKDEQERLLEQERKRQERELAEKYLERYVMKEVLFIPWGDREGEIGLKVVETIAQGIEPVISRYGATKLKIDKDDNIYIWDDVAYSIGPEEKILKMPKSNKILKYAYVKEKKDGKEIEKYKYVESIPLNLKITPKEGLQVVGKPFKIEEFESKYRYERYIMNKEDRRGLKVMDVNTGKEIAKIDFTGIDDSKTYYTEPLGSDAKGNIYVLIDTTYIRSSPRILEVYKYNIEGKLLAIVELLMDMDKNDLKWDLEWTDCRQKDRVTVDKNGNIYQLFAREDGVHILKYKLE